MVKEVAIGLELNLHVSLNHSSFYSTMLAPYFVIDIYVRIKIVMWRREQEVGRCHG